MLLLRAKASALEAVTAAVAVLEDDSCTNAGQGSNLTYHGTVECDACVMDGKSLLFGAVGALSGVANPVSVARRLVEEQQLGALPCGRVRPSILVGAGARSYCEEQGFSVKADLVSGSALKTYNRYKRKCQRAELSSLKSPKTRRLGNEDVVSQDSATSGPLTDSRNLDLGQDGARDDVPENMGGGERRGVTGGVQEDIAAETGDVPEDIDEGGGETGRVQEYIEEGRGEIGGVQEDIAAEIGGVQEDIAAEIGGVQDTVGAVCVDHEGNVASASSSGGIWLKHPGRLGPAAIYGSGCWAQNQISGDRPGIACVTSGCGEHLIQTVLAKTCCNATRCSQDMTHALTSVFREDFLGSEFLSSTPVKYGGALVLRLLKSDPGREAELAWIHSTASMCLAYMAGGHKAPRATLSRLDPGCPPGRSIAMGGHIQLLSPVHQSQTL
ncbi:threonine aspartase 1 isoform X2 [Aplysia californica]|nr:threonine aspartase 1 isoform X2 [Aplysia californica]